MNCELTFAHEHSNKKHRWLRRTAGSIVLGLIVTSPSLGAETADTAEGMRLFLQKANCQACHGWAGDGRKMDNQMPDGSNLRETTLDRAAVMLTIKCGRPGRNMPAFDKLAYSDRPYGALEGADGLVIVTEWQEFRNPDFEVMRRLMREKVIFDGRNLYDPKTPVGYGFTYHSIGRKPGTNA